MLLHLVRFLNGTLPGTERVAHAMPDRGLDADGRGDAMRGGDLFAGGAGAPQAA